MASGCAVSVAGGSKWLLQFKHQDAREGLAISRLPPLRPSTSLPPSLLRRLARTPDRCRLFTVAAQDSNPRQQQQQQQELDVSVLRFTFGHPSSVPIHFLCICLQPPTFSLIILGCVSQGFRVLMSPTCRGTLESPSDS